VGQFLNDLIKSFLFNSLIKFEMDSSRFSTSFFYKILLK
jgi:hypothetical protein